MEVFSNIKFTYFTFSHLAYEFMGSFFHIALSGKYQSHSFLKPVAEILLIYLRRKLRLLVNIPRNVSICSKCAVLLPNNTLAFFTGLMKPFYRHSAVHIIHLTVKMNRVTSLYFLPSIILYLYNWPSSCPVFLYMFDKMCILVFFLPYNVCSSVNLWYIRVSRICGKKGMFRVFSFFFFFLFFLSNQCFLNVFM